MAARPTSRSSRIKLNEAPPVEEDLVDDLVAPDAASPPAKSSGVRTSGRHSARPSTAKSSRITRPGQGDRTEGSQRLAKSAESSAVRTVGTSRSSRVTKTVGSAESSGVRASNTGRSSRIGKSVDAPESSAVRAGGTGRSSRIATKSSNRMPFVEMPGDQDDLQDEGGAPPAAPVSPVRSGLFILAGFVGLAIIGLLVYTLVLKDDPAETSGRSALVDAERSLNAAMAQLAQRQPEPARSEVANARKAFALVPDLPRLAKRRAELQRELEAIQPRIEKVSRDVVADRNMRLLQARLAKLGGSDLTDGEVARLEADCQAFVKNPLDPASGADPEVAKTYAAAVLEIKSRIGTVQAEVRRRQDQATVGQVTKLEGVIEPMLKQERFGEAMALLDRTAKEFPGAKLEATRTYVENAAETAWTSLNGFVEMKAKDVVSPAATLTSRELAKEIIRQRLDAAIATWGVEKYVSQAQDLRKNY